MNKPYNEPIKIIFKAKNNYEQYQYYIYIFVGNVSKDIKDILIKIKDLDLYSTLKKLTKNDIKILEDYYGELWYKYFFTYEYLENQFAKDSPNYEFIKTKININKYQTMKKNISFRTYGINFNSDETLHMISQLMTQNKSFDYSKIKNSIESYTDKGYYGGNNSNETVNLGGATNEDTTDDIDDIDDTIDESSNIDIDLENIDIDQLTKEMNEDFAKEEHKEQEYDNKQNNKDQKNIDEILKTNASNNLQKKMIEFDTKYDNLIYKASSRQTYNKYYIFNQYIYKDDTIKRIKEKICCSILNRSSFSKNYNYIIPSRQYLWFYDKSNTATPLGFIWRREYSILDYQYEPYQNIKLYENLNGALKNYYDDIVIRKGKLIKDIEENKILEDYLKYMINEDIYMVDIYNELKSKHTRTPDNIDKLYHTYIHIFYPDIQYSKVSNILNYINNTDQKNEIDYINSIYTDITPNLILTDKIMNIVNDIQIKNYNQINKIVSTNNIIQAKIILKLKSNDIINFNRLELFKIFDDFLVNNKYVFIQLVQPNKKMIYKFNEKIITDYIQNYSFNDKNDILEETPDTLSFVSDDINSSKNLKKIIKWFDRNKTGLTFKLLIDNKWMSVNLDQSGMLSYKIHWKEENQHVYSDIQDSYDIIKQLIKDINKTSIINKFNIPLDNDFETMFVSSIAKFKLPKDVNINHNVLSKFSRLFFPYFALVIEPRKRISQTHESDNKSKFGTYLRFKRISEYENNKKIELQIKKYLQYYDATVSQIINMICKQFNITTETANKYYENVLRMYPNIKKKVKNLLKLNDNQHYKTPGVDVSIQGKSPELYKLRISGVKNEKTSNNIINMVSVLLYLYYEIYLNNNAKFTWIKELLTKLNNIAERRYMVADYVDDGKLLHLDVSIDKYRLGYKPFKNQPYYKRVCQNSGKVKRQPKGFKDDVIDQLIKFGYKKNKASGYYEKQVVLKDGRKKTLRAIDLPIIDNKGKQTSHKAYYTCDPSINGEYMYVGLLSKSKSPFGEALPCCFKKEKLNVIENLNKQQSKQQSINEQFYILQDTVKLNEGRLGFLPHILDYFFNIYNNKEAVIDKHILLSIEHKQIKGGVIENKNEKDKEKIIEENNNNDKLIDENNEKLIDENNEKDNDKLIEENNNKDNKKLIEKDNDKLIEKDNEKDNDKLIDENNKKDNDKLIDENNKKLIDENNEKYNEKIIDENNKKLIDENNEKYNEKIIDENNKKLIEKENDKLIEENNNKENDKLIEENNNKENDKLIEENNNNEKLIEENNKKLIEENNNNDKLIEENNNKDNDKLIGENNKKLIEENNNKDNDKLIENDKLLNNKSINNNIIIPINQQNDTLSNYYNDSFKQNTSESIQKIYNTLDIFASKLDSIDDKLNNISQNNFKEISKEIKNNPNNSLEINSNNQTGGKKINQTKTKLQSNNKKQSHNQSINQSTNQSNNYYFKIGVDNSKNSFISSIAYCLNTSYSNIIMKCINALTGQNKELIFNALDNGKIKLEFNSIDRYITILKKSNINIKYIIHLLSIPGILLDEGLNILLFQKSNTQQNMFKSDYQLKYVNEEEINNIDSITRKTILICADNINYFPICSVEKIDNNNESKLKIKSLFNKNDEVIDFIKDYYYEFKKKNVFDTIYTAKDIINILNKKKIKIINQVIDTKNKVRFIVLNNNLLIPVNESGSLYNINITNKIDNYIQSIDNTLDKLKDIYSIYELNSYIPIALQYDKKKNNKYRIRSIQLNNKLYIPITKIYLSEQNKYKYPLIQIPYYDNIDKLLLNRDKNTDVIDDRIKIINYSKFKLESYELFKYHISEYLTNKLKKIITNIINSELNYDDKLDILKGFFFKIINNPKLNDVYSRLNRKVKSDLLNDAYDIHRFYIYDDSKQIDLNNYTNENIRKLCNTKSKDKCNNQCMWVNDNCIFSLSYKTAILFINKLSQEILNNEIRLKELLKEDGYYISAILNENYYTERKNQKVLVKQPNDKVNPFKNYYKSIMPYIIDFTEQDEIQKNNDDLHILKSFNNKYLQDIKSDKDGLLRAYANGMNWIINNKQIIYNKNLGYTSLKQEKIVNYIKSIIVDYLVEQTHNKNSEYKNININDIIVNIVNDSNTITDYKFVLDILYNINKIDIVLYNEYDIIIYKSNKNVKPGKDTINIKVNEGNNYYVIYY